MKRKLPDQPTPEMLKKLKTGDPVPPPSPNKGKSRAVTVEEVPDVDMDLANSSFAPGGDADYFVEEDDEGRFFGGGLTVEQKDILNIFDNAGGEGIQDEDVDALSLPSIRKLLTRFERAANKNQDHRSKYPDDPTKFIESEADLDTAIKSLLPLAQAPTLAYPELISSGTLTVLIGLLSHENADIVIDVVEVIHELTDEDVGGEVDEEAEEGEMGAEEALKALIEKLVGLACTSGCHPLDLHPAREQHIRAFGRQPQAP
jgi:beta-catenin-like protein 1